MFSRADCFTGADSILSLALRAGRTMLDCYFWLLDDEDDEAPLEPARTEPAQARNVDEESSQGNAEGGGVSLIANRE